MSNTNPLSKRLNDNLSKLNEKFKECPNIAIKNILLKDNNNNNNNGCFIYIKGLVDLDLINRDFVDPVLNLKYKDLTNENIM